MSDLTFEKERFVKFFENTGSNDLRVDGSVTSVDFTIDADPTREMFINAIRFESSGNGIRFNQFLSSAPSILTNGVVLTIRSNDKLDTFSPIKSTENFLAEFSLGPDNFNLFDQTGADQMRATLTFEEEIQIHKQGSFGTDDFLKITINDNLTLGMISFKALVFGYLREP